MTTRSRKHPGRRPTLRRSLTSRNIQFIALGGAIGSGLFYGSANTIGLAGPAVLFGYIIGGGIIFVVMRALGEMAVAEPDSGSFRAADKQSSSGWTNSLTFQPSSSMGDAI